MQFVLKIGFALARKGGIGEGGWAYSRHAMHMAAVLAGCRMALVSTSWTTSHPVGTNGCRNHSSHLVGSLFLVKLAVFGQECWLVGEP